MRAVGRQKEQAQAPSPPLGAFGFDQARAVAGAIVQDQNARTAQGGQEAAFHRRDKLGGSQTTHPARVGQFPVATQKPTTFQRREWVWAGTLSVGPGGCQQHPSVGCKQKPLSSP